MSVNHLYKRNNTYYYRIRIPKDLKHIIPAKEIKKSLKSNTIHAAKSLAKVMASKVEKTFLLLRSQVLSPEQQTYDKSEHFYNTLFHELSHASGHANRLASKSILEPSYFGSHEYSKEALVAEMSAAFLCGHSGIENITIENSAAYLILVC